MLSRIFKGCNNAFFSLSFFLFCFIFLVNVFVNITEILAQEKLQTFYRPDKNNPSEIKILKEEFEVSAGDSAKNGMYKSFYKSGKLALEGKFVANNKEGKFIEYHDSLPRKVKSFWNFSKDLKNGNMIILSYKGDTVQKGFYKNDTLNGTFVQYYEGNKIRSKTTFKNGLLNGKLEEFYNNGVLSKIAYYIDNQLDKDVIMYYESGKIKTIETFKNNMQIGTIYTYYDFNANIPASLLAFQKNPDKGVPHMEIEAENHIKNGTFRRYAEDSKLLEECYYKKDKLDGSYKRFHEIKPIISVSSNVNMGTSAGLLAEKTTYNNGLRIGNYTSFYEDGKPKEKSNFANQELDREVLTYYPNGNKKAESFFSGGKPVKTWLYYHENGNLSASVPYQNNLVDGIRKTYNDKKEILKEETYENGKKHKLTKIYQNRLLHIEENYILGRKSGDYTEYSTNKDTAGKVIVKGFYKNDLKHATWEFFDEKTGESIRKEKMGK